MQRPRTGNTALTLPKNLPSINTHCRITNFVIVEITPIGIQNLGWKFWIVWTVFNAVFLPVIYFFYPETGKSKLRSLILTLKI